VVQTIVGWIVPTQDASGVIYGTLVTAGTILAASENAQDVREVAITVLVTLVLYWIAHAYAEVIGKSSRATPSLTAAGRELVAESRMVGACVLPLAVLLVVDWLWTGFQLATTIALWTTVGLLFGWGVLAARQAGLSGGSAVVSGLLYTLLGLVIIALRLILVHCMPRGRRVLENRAPSMGDREPIEIRAARLLSPYLRSNIILL